MTTDDVKDFASNGLMWVVFILVLSLIVAAVAIFFEDVLGISGGLALPALYLLAFVLTAISESDWLRNRRHKAFFRSIKARPSYPPRQSSLAVPKELDERGKSLLSRWSFAITAGVIGGLISGLILYYLGF